ncbi:MAG: secondary thiamine-phosphate synthase enzyme YjbQ [Gammaproteobacteria bacterium]|nr:secondary thiamine-phosphate synthase enzyme YjbQ [Gammaproteobacteria bacterium]MBU1415947.1 secondary thiamine-phosphate synthase enzyme YjbQ [Gammaproteobacteria bacterium]
MRQASLLVTLAGHGRGLTEFTAEARRFLTDTGIHDGLLTVFCRHTSASLVVQENADPDVRHDLDAFFERLVPDGDPRWHHANEGPDDMSAHVRSALTQTSLGIPVIDGRLALGTWQGLYLWEHRTGSHRREVLLHLIGD